MLPCQNKYYYQTASTLIQLAYFFFFLLFVTKETGHHVRPQPTCFEHGHKYNRDQKTGAWTIGAFSFAVRRGVARYHSYCPISGWFEQELSFDHGSKLLLLAWLILGLSLSLSLSLNHTISLFEPLWTFLVPS